jgi:hypothetical protein
MISKSLPEVEHFIPVQPSKLVKDFVQLRTVDLSRYEDGPEARKELAEEVRRAMTTQGFFILVNHGLSEEDISRQVDIGHTILARTSDEEKHRLKAPIVEDGSYHGFKPRGHWIAKGNVRDKVENFNIYRDMTLREQPSVSVLGDTVPSTCLTFALDYGALQARDSILHRLYPQGDSLQAPSSIRHRFANARRGFFRQVAQL